MSRIVRKPDFCLGETKAQISFAVTAKLISAFVFATRIVQFLFYLNPKLQASSSFLSLYRPVCVGPGRKPRRPVFSRRGSYTKILTPLNSTTQIKIVSAMALNIYMDMFPCASGPSYDQIQS